MAAFACSPRRDKGQSDSTRDSNQKKGHSYSNSIVSNIPPLEALPMRIYKILRYLHDESDRHNFSSPLQLLSRASSQETQDQETRSKRENVNQPVLDIGHVAELCLTIIAGAQRNLGRTRQQRSYNYGDYPKASEASRHSTRNHYSEGRNEIRPGGVAS
jgi:hypothetical protein